MREILLLDAFFADVSLSFPHIWPNVFSEVAEKWCPDQPIWSWQALRFWKAGDVSRGGGLQKTKEILSYSTLDVSRPSV